jgi:hypothetical protein
MALTKANVLKLENSTSKINKRKLLGKAESKSKLQNLEKQTKSGSG